MTEALLVLLGAVIAAAFQWWFITRQRAHDRQVRIEQRELDKKMREDQRNLEKQVRAEQREERDRALATSLLFKLTKLTANLITLRQHVDEDFAPLADVGPDTQLWQVLTPIANLTDHIHFTADEMSVLLAQANDKVFNQVLGLDDQHNTMLTLMRTFQVKRAELNQKLEPFRIIDRVEGDRVDARFPMDVMRNHSPYMIDLNSLVAHLRTSLPTDARDARQATEAAQKLLRDKLGIKFKVQINDPPVAPAVQASTRVQSSLEPVRSAISDH